MGQISDEMRRVGPMISGMLDDKHPWVLLVGTEQGHVAVMSNTSPNIARAMVTAVAEEVSAGELAFRATPSPANH